MIVGLSSKQVSADGFDRSQCLWKNGDMEITKPTAPAQAMRPCQQPQQQQQQQRQQAQQQQQQGPPLRCPRCDSTNTKFCYYNNYSRSQPRHFCKACRRHWTNGGTLRNVPVGGRRKAKRPKSTSHQTSAPNSTADARSTIDSNGNDVPTTTHPSQQVLPPPSFGQLLQLPLTPTDYGNNGDINTNFLGALLPLPPVPEFDGTGMISSHDVDGGGGGYAPATSTPFPSLLSFTGQEDLGGMDPSIAVAMATPWESLPPSSCSSGPGPGGGSTITTSGGPAVLEPSSPSSGYWGSCWDDLTGFLSPDHRHPTPPPLPPPPQDLQLS
ncbi:hypothetical protein Taro_026199 [Colocasia esculenta]|uniref:Dof zinc finger protein n=1 Tax=Colocasia esculenta TaxID=4460 RepID=A0A843VC94_COLES|nr:hypothetical protein [Colocasia esculenta]